MAINRLSAARAAELGKQPGLYVRACHGGVAMNRRELFRLEAISLEGKPMALQEQATPSLLTLHGDGFHPKIEILFASAEALRLRGSGCGARLVADPAFYDFARPARSSSWEINLASARTQVLVTPIQGRMELWAPWQAERCEAIELRLLPSSAAGAWEVELREFMNACPPEETRPAFEPCADAVHREWQDWLQNTPQVRPEWEAARTLAAYVQWASLARPRDRLRREAMLMSKNWMVNVWSWDHCFNAIALAARQPALAWDQWRLPFDFQNAFGGLPDFVNDHDILWNFTKPPVHGWALREMRARGFELSQEQAAEAAEALEGWTRWWLEQRDEDGDGVPQYNHGNDSGWDNATAFAAGMPVEAPDLSAYLILQMEMLAELCGELGREAQKRRWQQEAAALQQRLLEHSWREDRFVAPRSGTHEVATEGDCLLLFLPLLLGSRLPTNVRHALMEGVAREGRFLTAHGPATESPRSPLYLADGYWRGPIWAPATHLLVCGLQSCGAPELARKVAKRFCATVAQSGCAENFHALSGEGLRDRAYTWTASVFLALAEA